MANASVDLARGGRRRWIGVLNGSGQSVDGDTYGVDRMHTSQVCSLFRMREV
jgi:hypothetical protein